MDFEWNWTNLQALARKDRGSRRLSLAAWLLWAAFIALWAASLLPFYAAGLHLFSHAALTSAGAGSGRSAPYAPLPTAVYGTSLLGALARVVVLFGPCVFALVFLALLLRLLTSWRTYSPLGLTLRLAALLLTLTLIAFSYDLATAFLTWGTG